jgi:hypothetical protein
MDKIAIAKGTVTLIVGAGTSKIVHQIIKNNTEPQSVVDTVTILIGSFVFASMAVDASKKYTDSKLDEFIALWHNRNSTDALSS